MQDERLYRDEAGYPGGGCPAMREKAGYPGGGSSPGSEKNIYPGVTGREAIHGFLAAPDLAGGGVGSGPGRGRSCADRPRADRTFSGFQGDPKRREPGYMRDLWLPVNIVCRCNTAVEPDQRPERLVYLLDDQGRIFCYPSLSETAMSSSGKRAAGRLLTEQAHGDYPAHPRWGGGWRRMSPCGEEFWRPAPLRGAM